MRQTISGLVAAIALVTASAVPAMACGFGVCCGWAYGSPCAQTYVPAYGLCRLQSAAAAAGPMSGCPIRCSACAPMRPQYYYVNQGPTYTGPGNFAPYPTYQEARSSQPRDLAIARTALRPAGLTRAIALRPSRALLRRYY